MAKDLSLVNVKSLKTRNVLGPISLYIKKPEFGAPELNINNLYPFSKVKKELISTDSILKINQKIIQNLLEITVMKTLMTLLVQV